MKDKKGILNSEPSVLTEALHYKTAYHCRVKERERARRQEEVQKGRRKFPVDEGGGEIAVCCCSIKHTPQRDKPRLISSSAIFQLQEAAAREVG